MKKRTFIGCGLVIVIFILLVIGIGTCLGGNSSIETKDLSASVYLDGTIFTIKNNDSFDWYNIEFILNSDYKLSEPLLSAKSTYIVDATQFAKNDGTRFNPFTMKALNMSISCELSDGNKGWWYGGWK